MITNEKEIDEWINEAEEAGELAIDTETSSLDAHQDRLSRHFIKHKDW